VGDETVCVYMDAALGATPDMATLLAIHISATLLGLSPFGRRTGSGVGGVGVSVFLATTGEDAPERLLNTPEPVRVVLTGAGTGALTLGATADVALVVSGCLLLFSFCFFWCKFFFHIAGVSRAAVRSGKERARERRKRGGPGNPRRIFLRGEIRKVGKKKNRNVQWTRVRA